MPLRALHRDTGESILITDFEQGLEIELTLKPLAKDKLLICPSPDCGAEFMIKNGAVVTPHFAHRGHQCRTQYGHHPESVAHQRGKIMVAELIKKRFGEYIDTIRVEFEVPIPQVRRIADVAVLLKNGILQVHEVQLASITTEELERRTHAYETGGIDVQWWFGGKAQTKTNEVWALERFEKVFFIDAIQNPEQESYLVTNQEAIGDLPTSNQAA